MKVYLKIFAFTLIFFFGEIAISFSDKATVSVTEPYNSSSFSLLLDNTDSDFEEMMPVDQNIKALLDQYKIQGASVAICRNDRLVYAKGFGYANFETGEMVNPSHSYRLASVSKLITAVAIMKLYDEGVISLDDQVFGPAGILPFTKFQKYEDKRVEQITIRHLLNHSAGWSRHAGDPMFNSLYIARKYKTEKTSNLDMIIRYALERELHYEPGSVYSYSNLGYGILGEIISIKSEMPYEDYVVLNIFKPLGLHDFHLGRSFYHQKYPNEVRYYEPSGSLKTHSFNGSGDRVPNSYGGNNMELLAAAGGWVASAPELAKFLLAIDPANKKPSFLKKETLKMMTDPAIAGKGLFGWRGVDMNGTSWRTGTLSGSASLIMRQSNGITWVVLLNGSTSKDISIHNRIAAAMFSAIGKITHWPESDLFNKASFGNNGFIMNELDS